MTLRRVRHLAAVAAIAGLPFGALPASALITFGPPQALNSTASTDADSSTGNDDVDLDISLASNGASNWVATWSSDNPFAGLLGPDSDILVATSNDDGETWSPADNAMAAAIADTAPDTSPRIAYGSNVWVIAFSSSNNLGDTVENDQDILFTRSIDNGNTWSAPDRINSGGLSDSDFDVDLQPAIATNGSGAWIIAWKHNGLSVPTGDRYFYSYSTDHGQTWSSEIALGALQSVNAGNGQGIALAWTGTDFVAIWGSAENLGANGNDGDILVSHIAAPYLAPTPPALLNSSGTADSAIDSYPSLAADGATLVATWSSKANVGGIGSDADILFSRSTDGGTVWSAPVAIADNAAADVGEDIDVSVDSDGDSFVVVWASNNGLDNSSKIQSDILTTSSTNGLTWEPVKNIATNAAKEKRNNGAPVAVANRGTGTWDVAWISSDTLTKTIGDDEDVLFVHSSTDCPAMPVAAAGCFQQTAPLASSMIIKEGGAKDSFLWKFVKGPAVDKAADIGTPNSTDDYVLCVYDQVAGTPELVIELDIEAGGNCFSKPCWTDIGTGYSFKHKFGVVAGASLVGGTAGTTKASVKAKSAFSAPPLPLLQGTTVSARLHNTANGKCWATDFTTNSSNTAGLFKAKAD